LVREDACHVLVARRVALLAVVVGARWPEVGGVEERRRVRLGRVVVVHVLGRLDPAQQSAVVAERVDPEERPSRLLHDVVTEVLAPLPARGITDIDVLELQKPLKRWVAEEKTSAPWSDPTVERIAQGLLSALRDFGVLQGAVKKRIAPAYLPVEAFAYIAFYLKQHQPSGAKLAELPDWKLFFLPREGVERAFFEAHQSGLLEYHAAGSVTRLTFPAATLEEYAHALTKRTH
jgi:hypothetical protein